MKIVDEKIKIVKYTKFATLVCLLVVLIWPVFMFLTTMEGSNSEKLFQAAQQLTLVKINYLWVLMLAPLLTTVVFLFLELTNDATSSMIWRTIGSKFFIPYLTLVSISYASQIIYFPSLLADWQLNGSEEVIAWFLDNPTSIPYFLNQLGYTLLAIGLIIIGCTYFHRSRMEGILGSLLIFSGVLQWIAFIGLAFTINSLYFFTLLSGFVIIPILLCILRIAQLTSKSE